MSDIFCNCPRTSIWRHCPVHGTGAAYVATPAPDASVEAQIAELERRFQNAPWPDHDGVHVEIARDAIQLLRSQQTAGRSTGEKDAL